jgi:enterochelin esterase family protein
LPHDAGELEVSEVASGPARRDPLAFAGRVELHELTSKVLDGGRYGDPTTRQLAVYVPPEADGPLPVIFLLPGFTGNWMSYLKTHPWEEGVVKAYDRGVAAGKLGPALLVMPDCFTKLGGSQFVDSSLLGNYETYLTDEVIPFVDGHFVTNPDARRGLVGKSSGGFGAMRLSMRHSDLFGAAASISGDVNFEMGYAAEFPAALRALVSHDMDPAKFLDAFFTSKKLKSDDHALLNTLAMAACYSPAPDTELGFELPFDLETCRRIVPVWQRWLAFDPLEMIESEAHQEAWRSMDLLHLECGLRDQFHLQWGLRRLATRLDELDIPHQHIEHEGSHFDINDRYPPAIDAVARALAN